MIVKFSPAEKLKAVERELALRKVAYPKWVKNKKLSQAVADHELKIMEAIRDDYKTWALTVQACRSIDEADACRTNQRSTAATKEAKTGTSSISASPPPATSTKS